MPVFDCICEFTLTIVALPCYKKYFSQEYLSRNYFTKIKKIKKWREKSYYIWSLIFTSCVNQILLFHSLLKIKHFLAFAKKNFWCCDKTFHRTRKEKEKRKIHFIFITNIFQLWFMLRNNVKEKKFLLSGSETRISRNLNLVGGRRNSLKVSVVMLIELFRLSYFSFSG